MKPRCSSLDRFLACPESGLECGNPYNPESPEAAKGQAKHEALAAVEANQDYDAIDIAARYGDDADEIEKAVAAYRKVRAELMAWFPSAPTVYVELALDGPVCRGTADWIGVSADEVTKHPTRLVVNDYKSGWGTSEHPLQLAGYASCAREEFGMPTCGYITVVESQLRHGERIVHNYSSEDLDRFEASVTDAVAHMGKRVQAGPQCTFCRRQMVCTARAEYARGAMAALVETTGAGIATREQIGALYDRYRDVMRAVKLYDKLLSSALGTGPIELPGGRRIELREKEQTVIEPKAIDVLRDYGWSTDDIRQIVSVTKAAIERVVKQSAPKGKADGAMRKIMGVLGEGGALGIKVRREKVIVGAGGIDGDAE